MSDSQRRAVFGDGPQCAVNMTCFLIHMVIKSVTSPQNTHDFAITSWENGWFRLEFCPNFWVTIWYPHQLPSFVGQCPFYPITPKYCRRVNTPWLPWWHFPLLSLQILFRTTSPALMPPDGRNSGPRGAEATSEKWLLDTPVHAVFAVFTTIFFSADRSAIHEINFAGKRNLATKWKLANVGT